MFGKKDKPTTLEEVKKAYESLSDEDKEQFKQSFSDRVDESVGAQEEADEEKDEQSSKDRVDEAEGAEKADESEPEEKPAEESAEEPAADESEPEESDEAEAEQKQVFILDRIADLLEKLVSQKASDDESKLAESSKKYATGLNGGYAGEKGGDKYSAADVERLLRNR